MSPMFLIILVLLVVFYLSQKKRTEEGQKSPKRPAFEPLKVELEEGCWSCGPEELLENLSLAVYQTKSIALPAYVFGQGYEVQDVRHWLTLLTAPNGKLAEAVVTWDLDDEDDIRQAASYYAGTLLSIFASGEQEAMIKEINRLIGQHKAGQRDELVKLSAMSRVSVLVMDQPQRMVTIRLTPLLPGELIDDGREKGQPDTAAGPQPGNDPAGEAEDAKE